MKRVVIFGVKDFAQLANYYLQTDSQYEVEAFAVHERYLDGITEFEGLPVVAFESVEEQYPPEEFAFFAPMAPAQMNQLRESVYHEVREKGYQCISYISSKATVFDNVRIGENCFILEDNTIQPFVEIGSNTILWSGNHIGHHSRIGDHVFIASHAVLCGHTDVQDHCFVGVNSSIVEHVKLAEGTFIAMNSAVIAETEAWGAYRGNPALKQKKTSLEYMP